MRPASIFIAFIFLSSSAYAKDSEIEIKELFEAIFDEDLCPEYYSTKSELDHIEEYTLSSPGSVNGTLELARVECNLIDMGSQKSILHAYFLNDGFRFSLVSFVHPVLNYGSEDPSEIKGYITRPGLMDAQVDEAMGRIVEHVNWNFEGGADGEQGFASRGEWYFSETGAELRYYDEVFESGGPRIIVLDLR